MFLRRHRRRSEILPIAWLMAVGFGFLAAARIADALPFPESAITDPTVWKEPAFLDEFRPEKAPSNLAHKVWPEQTEIFGLRPHSIVGRFNGDRLESINILFLDSGTHFGYVPRTEAKENEATNRKQFQALYSSVESAVRGGIAKIAGESGELQKIGTEPMLTQGVTLFRTGNCITRLHAIEEQLIKLTVFTGPDSSEARYWFDPAELERRDREREADFEKNVLKHPNGDVMLENIPLLPQGDRAYCGVSALAMAMQYLGLNIDTEDYAAAAGIRYGSTRGSHIREVYDAAGEEAGFRMTRATRFDYSKMKRAIDAGLPVLVWRRWNQERDYLHSVFAKRFSKDPNLELPKPDAEDRDQWPGDKSFTHATVITGYNEDRREIIFTESWSEHVRNRRMRVEEMEGTAYYTFILRL